MGVDARLSRFWWSGARPSIGDQLDVQLSVDTEAFAEAARCVNEEWGASIRSELQIGDSLFVFIALDGAFNLDLLIAQYTRVPGVIQAQAVIPTPPPVITDDEAFVRGVTRDGEVYTYSFFITKQDCSIELSIAVDADGAAHIAEWKSVPEAAECQRLDGGL